MTPNITFDPAVDYYAALGVAQGANADEIKRAYRKLAKRYHPDATGNDKAKEKRFKEVTAAYEVLGDKAQREQYDAMRAGGFNPFAGGGHGGAGAGVDMGDLFSQFFGGGAHGHGGGSSYRVYTSGGPGGGEVPFETMFGGGSGGGFDSFQHAEPRPRRRKAQAKAAPAERTVLASDGSTLTQRGPHVHSDVRLALDEAILGTTKSVATLSGRATVKIPPGTSSGVKLRLKGKGVRTLTGGHGDHFVTVQIDVPKALHDDGKKAVVEFMRKLKT